MTGPFANTFTDIETVDSKYLVLLLPFPPTVNALYAGGSKGRFKNKRYTKWEAEAHRTIRGQHLKHFSTPVSIVISYGRPDKRTRDVLNYDKAICDFLCHPSVSVLMDDSLIEKATVQWADDVVGALIEITEIP